MISALMHLVTLIQESVSKFSRDDGTWLASAMAYYAAFSLFPLILVLVAILGFLLRVSASAQDAQRTVLELVARNASPTVAALLDQVLGAVQAQAGISGPFGLIVLLITAAGMFAALDGAFIRLWNVPAPAAGGIVAVVRLILFQRLAGFVMLLALGGLVVAAFAGGLMISAIGTYAGQLPYGGLVWQVAQGVINTAIDTAVFAVIYKVLPKPYVRWSDALAGALFASVVWELGRLLLALVLAGQSFSAYGVVGAFIALMAWIYYACSIFFIGAELVQVRRQHAGIVRALAPVQTAPPESEAMATTGSGGEPAGHAQPPHRLRARLPAALGAALRARLGALPLETAGLFLTLLAGVLYATLRVGRHH